eukprot:TCONS_00061310-protein
MLMYCRNHLSRLKLSNKVIISSPQCGCSTEVSPPLKKKRKLIYAKGKTFVDWKRIYIKSGNGGNGSASFVHSRDHKGGPDGGDGGRGADVIFIADDAYSQLSHLEHQYRAKNGGNGSKKNRHGKNGEHLHIQIPVGTVITNSNSDEELADLTRKGETYTVAKGGSKGLGNVHFKSPTRVRPREFTEGGAGEEIFVELELKSIADIGLVGFPNAGKSSLLHCISRATPKIGDYPFTTLKPNIGVMNLKDDLTVSVADIPGIVKGAHENIGLGHEFLRHVERCHMLMYVMDCSSPDMLSQFEILKTELDLYKAGLSTISSIFIANKIDLIQDQDEMRNNIQQHVNMPVVPLSAKFSQNIEELKSLILQKWKFKHTG